MEELEDPGTPVLDPVDEPEANQDPADPLQPDIEEEHSPNAPLADPTADPDALENDAPDEQPEPDNDPAMDVDPEEEEESDLDELDEAQFDEFDPEAANIVVPVDETNVGLLGVHKRKRTEEEERERKKKKKEGRRERLSKKSKKRVDGDDMDADGEGARPRGDRVKAPRREKTPEDESALSPEERRRRALERKMDEALRTNKPSRRRRHAAGESLEDTGEQELATMRIRMATAAQKDAAARMNDQPASHKILLLPKVVELLNRNTLKDAILDPEINILEAVRFFLEPSSGDAALPNYEIQREMFKVLTSLQMTKEALIASQIGKVIMYYTKSNQPQPAIKRSAEKLLQQWMTIVLNKKRSSKLKKVEQRRFDAMEASQRGAVPASQADRAAEKRRKALEIPTATNRARVDGGLATYTIAPVNTLSQAGAGKRAGGGGDEIFKRLQAKTQKQTGGVGRK